MRSAKLSTARRKRSNQQTAQRNHEIDRRAGIALMQLKGCVGCKRLQRDRLGRDDRQRLFGERRHGGNDQRRGGRRKHRSAARAFASDAGQFATVAAIAAGSGPGDVPVVRFSAAVARMAAAIALLRAVRYRRMLGSRQAAVYVGADEFEAAVGAEAAGAGHAARQRQGNHPPEDDGPESGAYAVHGKRHAEAICEKVRQRGVVTQ